MNRKTRNILYGLLALGLVCGAAQAQNTGSADFRRLVAVGDSLTAGLYSSGLAVTQQVNSYGALIHARVNGAGPYAQPLVDEPGIGTTACPSQLFLNDLTFTSEGNIVPDIGCKSLTPGAPSNALYPDPYNNLGIPGADVSDLLNTACGGFFDLVLRNVTTCPAGGTTALNQAVVQQPTFVLLWIGNNEALGAATSGGLIPPTDPTSFDTDFTTLIRALRADGADVAVGNVFDVTTIPFVTELSPFVVINGMPIALMAATSTGLRALTEDDFVLLPAADLIGQGFGLPGQTPLPDQVVLDEAEAAVVQTAVNAYNVTIASQAAAEGAVLVDTNAALADVAANGLTIGGIDFDTGFLTGGLFGYDGVHPTPLGYGIIANTFIDAINAGYGAAIPAVDLFPFVFGGSGPATGGAVMVPEELMEGFVFPALAGEATRTVLGVPPLDELIDPGDVPVFDRPGLRDRRHGPAGKTRTSRGDAGSRPR